MIKLATLALLTCISATAFASTEVVCDGINVGSTSDKIATGAVINQRIRQLNSEGKTVEITQLTSSTGATNNAVVDKVCAVLKYY